MRILAVPMLPALAAAYGGALLQSRGAASAFAGAASASRRLAVGRSARATA